MNRRKFLKVITGLSASIPFFPLPKASKPDTDKGLQAGIDKAESGGDMTGMVTFDNQGILTNTIVFDEPLSDHDIWLMKNAFCECTYIAKFKEMEWIL